MSQLTQGALAVRNGKRLMDAIANRLGLHGFSQTRANTLADFLGRSGTLAGYVEAGWFSRECRIPLTAPYHTHSKATAKVDFVVSTTGGNVVLISAKSQESDGSAEEKLEYEVHQLLATELPSALLVHGPIKGRNGAKEGFHLEVLSAIWSRARFYGNTQIYLFRDIDKLSAWIGAGLPVAGGSAKYSAVFAEWCSREP